MTKIIKTTIGEFTIPLTSIEVAQIQRAVRETQPPLAVIEIYQYVLQESYKLQTRQNLRLVPKPVN